MMASLRRYSTLIATLVLLAVSTQMLDLGFCCGRSLSASPASEHVATFSTAETGPLVDAAAQPVAAEEGRSTGSQAANPDCLCHLVFTSTSLAPALLAAAAATSLPAEAPESLRSTLIAPPGHVPIA